MNPNDVEITTYVGTDGVPVVQVDTPPSGGRVRINLNDAPVWDADPEHSPGPTTGGGSLCVW